MLVIVRWTAVFLAATALLFAIRWPSRLPYRNTVLLGGFSVLAIAGSPLVFAYGTAPMVAGTILGLGLMLGSCWTVFHASRSVGSPMSRSDRAG
ncbi:MAG TPA: hypothetical protein VJU15_04320 [Gemmatimonadales bacterium]|nr:hypothetical protein [Gemmatimonadales bacterium]